MKRLLAVALLSLAMPMFAQVRGVPASVTSMGAGRGDTPGIPASVTSLGPNGYGNSRWSQPAYQGHSRNFGNYNYNSMCSTPGALIPSAMGCTSTYFTNQNYGLPLNAGPTNARGRGRGHNGGGTYPVYVPYAVPVVVSEGPPEPDPRAVEEEADEPPAMTVFERRPTLAAPLSSAPPIDESRVYHPAPNQVTAPATEQRQAPAIVLIYKDGREREVQNYAIMGNYLYDIGTFVAQKIPLADLNLKETLKANNDRGVEFSLPVSIAP